MVRFLDITIFHVEMNTLKAMAVFSGELASFAKVGFLGFAPSRIFTGGFSC